MGWRGQNEQGGDRLTQLPAKSSPAGHPIPFLIAAVGHFT